MINFQLKIISKLSEKLATNSAIIGVNFIKIEQKNNVYWLSNIFSHNFIKIGKEINSGHFFEEKCVFI
jgi:hypothetical protein